jgi:hypothetical protein
VAQGEAAHTQQAYHSDNAQYNDRAEGCGEDKDQYFCSYLPEHGHLPALKAGTENSAPSVMPAKPGQPCPKIRRIMSIAFRRLFFQCFFSPLCHKGAAQAFYRNTPEGLQALRQTILQAFHRKQYIRYSYEIQ